MVPPPKGQKPKKSEKDVAAESIKKAEKFKHMVFFLYAKF